MLFPKIPLDKWIESLVDWLAENLEVIFDVISMIIGGIVNSFSFLFHAVPTLVFIGLFAVIAWFFVSKSFALFTLLGLLLIDNFGYWSHTMNTLALVVTAAFLSVIFGLPLGVWCSKRESVQKIFSPILDFMQTMPAFVYLIPAVIFFGLGVVPGVIASVIFAVPPTIRLTNLGIRQVPRELIEASDAFGSTSAQKLFKVQLPLAMPTIMAGVNQTIMLSLSMVVIASMIGAQGLGTEVYRAVTRQEVGKGFQAGLAVVILAILLDRLSQSMINKKKRK